MVLKHLWVHGTAPLLPGSGGEVLFLDQIHSTNGTVPGCIIGLVPLALHRTIEYSGPLPLWGLFVVMCMFRMAMGLLVQGINSVPAPILGRGFLYGLQGNMGFHFDLGFSFLDVCLDLLDPFSLGKGAFHMDLTTLAAHTAYSIVVFHDISMFMAYGRFPRDIVQSW